MIPYKFNPLGISRSSKEYFSFLTFTAIQDNSSVTLTQIGTPNTINLYYKTSSSNIWSPYIIDTEIPLSQGQYVQFWNKGNLFSKSSTDYYQFVMTGKIAGSGNVQSLLNFSKSAFAYCYFSLFDSCTSLVTAPELPAMTLNYDCYRRMFYDCTSLTVAPELPATTLASECYAYMFAKCSSLTLAPELPATNISQYCYYLMFSNCSLLTLAPELPATLLKAGCYGGMFASCTSLATAPELPATALAIGCYTQMFYYCSSLTEAPALPATTLANNCYQEMFRACTSLTAAPELPAAALANNCYNWMFLNCRNLTEMNVGFTAWNDSATSDWLYLVSASGTFTKPASLPEEYGSSRIPTGWTIINK